jgi:hypothetical protein
MASEQELKKELGLCFIRLHKHYTDRGKSVVEATVHVLSFCVILCAKPMTWIGAQVALPEKVAKVVSEATVAAIVALSKHQTE